MADTRAAKLHIKREKAAEYRKANRALLREKQRQYFAANRELIRARAPVHQARYKAKHPERQRDTARAACARSRETKPARVREWQAKYRATHVTARRVFEANRRGRLQNAPGAGISQEQWMDLLREACGLCAYCGKRKKRLTLDHIVPLSAGGEHDVSNAAAACGSCNSSKHDTGLLVWLARRAVGLAR